MLYVDPEYEINFLSSVGNKYTSGQKWPHFVCSFRILGLCADKV
jgi:hypothetical protein